MRQHILLVEDESYLRNSLRVVLQGEGYRVDVAAVMAEAKYFLESTQYTLVIADWQLPDGDGTVILEWAAHLGAKTVLMSGYLSQMPGGRSFAHETLTKPLRLREMVSLVERAIGKAVDLSC